MRARGTFLAVAIALGLGAGCVPTIIHVEPEADKARPAADPAECRETMRYAFEALELVEATDPGLPAEEIVPKQAKGLGLDAWAVCAVRHALDRIADPCVPERTLLHQLSAAAQPCQRARTLGRAVVDLAARGHGVATVTRELLRLLERESRALAQFVMDHSPSLGDNRAPVVIVEFLDFGCEQCRAVGPRVKALVKKHAAVLYVKHYPQPGVHAGADYAARASLAAHRQQRFWPMYEALFASSSLREKVVDGIAARVKLDMARYKADMSDPSLQQLVARDMREAESVGVQGTPVFFVNGRRVDGVKELEQRLNESKTRSDKKEKGHDRAPAEGTQAGPR